MGRKIDQQSAPTVVGSKYPPPFDALCRTRFRSSLGDAAGLTRFGVNLTTLPPGCWSSQRHWHTVEDEFIYIVAGEVVLVTDAGEEILRAGDCAGFKAGEADGHHLQNRSGEAVSYLEIGTRDPEADEVIYPDIDLRALKGRRGYARRDGSLYPGAKPRNPATDR